MQHANADHLGSGIPPVEIRQVHLPEPSTAEQLVGDNHLVLGNFDLLELALPPRAASPREGFRLCCCDGSLMNMREKGHTTWGRNVGS